MNGSEMTCLSFFLWSFEIVVEKEVNFQYDEISEVGKDRMELFMKQRQIFVAFLRSGILGFGGGPAGIPLIKKEVVERYHLMTEDEFYETMAIGNTLPGPIVTKLAGYIGYKVGGIWGMLNATFAAVIPSVIMIIVLFKVLFGLGNTDVVQGMTNGVLPIIAVLMLGVFIDLMKKTKKSFGWLKGLSILAIAMIAIVIMKIHPGIVVGIAILLAFVLPVKKGGKV